MAPARKAAKMPITAAAAMVAILVLSAVPTRAGPISPPGTWASYGNARFNFAVCHPPSLKGAGEADNSDGQEFRAPDGAALAAFGSNLAPGEGLDADLDATVRDLGGAGAHVTYRLRRGGWLVVSGEGARGEFYLKRVLRKDQMISWRLTYPARLHGAYAPLISRMLACFTVGAEAGDG